jgi:hypothetical protein
MHPNGKNGLMYVRRDMLACHHCRDRPIVEVMALMAAACQGDLNHFCEHLVSGIGASELADRHWYKHDLMCDEETWVDFERR